MGNYFYTTHDEILGKHEAITSRQVIRGLGEKDRLLRKANKLNSDNNGYTVFFTVRESKSIQGKWILIESWLP